MDNDTVKLKIVGENDTDQAVDETVDGLTKVSRKSEDVRATFTKVGLAMAGVGAAITVYAKNATDYTVSLASDTKKLSRETGLAVEESSELVYVTRRLGLDAGQTSVSFGNLSRQIVQTNMAANPATTTLGRLNIATQNADGSTRSFNDVLLDVADTFKGMPDGPEKTALALELFGKSGKDMIKVLNLGSDGIRELEERAQKYGLTLNSTTIAAVAKYTRSQRDLEDSTNSVKIAVGSLTAPVLARFNTTLASVITKVVGTEGPLRNFAANVLAFGGPIMSAAGSTIAFAANAKTAGLTIRGVGTAIAGAARFLGPWGLAISAVVTIGGGLLAFLHGQKNKTDDAAESTDELKTVEEELSETSANLARNTDRLTQAQEANEKAARELKDSQLSVTSAQYGVEAANLRVETAQKALTEAIREHGRNSLEARQADLDLREAKLGVEEATQRVASAQADLTQKTKDATLAQDNLNSANQILIDKGDSVRNSIQLTIGKFNELNGVVIATKGSIDVTFSGIQGSISTIQGKVQTLQGNVKTLQGNVNSIQMTGSLQGFSATPKPRAAGGPVEAGQAYWVGDNPDGSLNSTSELFVPKQDGTIVPQGKMGGGKTVNIGMVVLGSADAVRAFFGQLDNDSILMGKGLSPVRGGI